MQTPQDRKSGSDRGTSVTSRQPSQGSRSSAKTQEALETLYEKHGENAENPELAETNYLLGIELHAEAEDSENCAEELEKAGHAFTDALEMYRSLYPEGHADTVKTLNGLGVVRQDQGSYTKAISCFEQALKMNQTLYGMDEEHIEIADTLHKLGVVCQLQAEHAKARTYFSDEVDMLQSLNADPLKIATAWNHQGQTYQDLNNNIRAESCFRQALEKYHRAYPDMTHLDVAKLSYRLGNLCLVNNHLEDARTFLSDALAMFRGLFVKEPEHTFIQDAQAALNTVTAQIEAQKPPVVLSQPASGNDASLNHLDTPNYGATTISHVTHVTEETPSEPKRRGFPCCCLFEKSAAAAASEEAKSPLATPFAKDGTLQEQRINR
ncbi:MAG: tetratricopeptide repeat protein [Gammaproteobacteria bacterium]|nr:tetratricopeptide repeat protein [Gammaproteobacteria bacterium]